MVLDHLVVQQMGKENEEGEIDNMLLHGAAALYDTTNEEGISASDIRYTSKDVDELIDKVEADADIEAKALKEKNEAFANGEAGQEMQEVAKPKESMSFGFAKIWEADQNRLQEISDDVDERAEDTEAWQLVMENAERERLAALMMTGANGQRSKRQAVLVKLRYGPDGPRKTKNKTKGKKRKTAAESSDTEFALAADGGGSESDSTMSPGVDGSDDLFDHEGNPTVRGLAAGKKGLNKKEFKALQAVRQAAAKAVLDASGSTEGIPPGDLLMGQDGTIVHGSNGAGPSIPPPSKISNAQETLEERAARKARRKEEKYQKKLRAHEDKPHLIHAQLGEQRLQGGSQAPRPIIPRNLSSRQNHVPDVVDAARVVAGQHILQWMYHTLRELGFHEHLGIWAKMALPELPGHERFQFYKQLATMVDDELYHRGQLPYFDGAEQIDQVLPILMGGKPVIPDLSQPVDQSFPALSNEMRTYRTASSTAPRRYAQHLPSPHQSPQPAPRQIAAPAQPGPPLTIARPASRSSLAGQGDGDAWQSTCTFCQNPGHNIKECGQAPSISDLESIRDSLAQGSHAEAEMATSKLEHITPGLHGVTPAEALVEVERLLRLHAEGVSKRQIHLSEPFALTNNPHLNDRTTIQKTTTLVKNGTSVTPGSRDAAIVIDDEEDDTVTTEAKTSDQVGTSQRSCPYCGEVCKRTIRHCATVYHDGDDAQGRKGLKARIRELDGRRDKLEEATVGGKGDPVMRRERDSLTQVIEELFGCYQVVSTAVMNDL